MAENTIVTIERSNFIHFSQIRERKHNLKHCLLVHLVKLRINRLILEDSSDGILTERGFRFRALARSEPSGEEAT